MSAHPRRRTALAVLGLLPLLVGCGSILSKPPERQLYRLSPNFNFRQSFPQIKAQLLIATPSALAGFDTARVPLSRSPISLEYFADAEWTDRIPFLVQAAAIEGFQKSQAFSGVSSDASGLTSDFVLALEVRDFAAVYDSPTGPPRARVQLNAALVQMPGRKIVAEISLRREAAAAGNDIPAIVLAFTEALGGVVEELVTWTVNTPVLSPGRRSVISRADTFRSRRSTGH
jgi:cholesterol transport system auxiliary component